MIEDYGTLQVGQEVVIYSEYGHCQGPYTVTKANKVVVTLSRKSDGYLRSFSVKTKQEKNEFSTRYKTAYIVSIEESQQIEAAKELQHHRNQLWKEVEIAAIKKNLHKIQELILQLQ